VTSGDRHAQQTGGTEQAARDVAPRDATTRRRILRSSKRRLGSRLRLHQLNGARTAGRAVTLNGVTTGKGPNWQTGDLHRRPLGRRRRFVLRSV